MIQDTEPYPPPEHWIRVEVPWSVMLENSGMCHAVLAWCLEHGSEGHFQLRGSQPNPTRGYLFSFERPQDATLFALRWTK
jgi:hypothetical protein